jgi:hypothetical protein
MELLKIFIAVVSLCAALICGIGGGGSNVKSEPPDYKCPRPVAVPKRKR